MLELSRINFNQLVIDGYLKSVSKLPTLDKRRQISDVEEQKEEIFKNHHTNIANASLKSPRLCTKLKLLEPEPITKILFNSADTQILQSRNDLSESFLKDKQKISSKNLSSWKIIKLQKLQPENFSERLNLNPDFYPLPIITKGANLSYIYLDPLRCFNNKREVHISILTPFYDLLYFYQQIQFGKTLYVVIQHGTKSIKLSHRYILTTKNPIQLVLMSYSKNYTVDLLQTDVISIPLVQIPNWKLIVLYETQKANGRLKLVNVRNYMKQNKTIQITMQDKSQLIFDLNMGMLIIPYHKTCMHRSNFHKIEYNKVLSILIFKMLFLEEIVILTHPSNNCTDFVNEVNCWSTDFENQSDIFIFENIKFNDSILYANDVIYNFNEECYLILYYNRFELYKKKYKHQIRTYLNNNLDLRFKLIFSAKWNDICSLEQELNNISNPYWVLLCVSYICGDGFSILNKPKYFNFTSETVLQKQKWLKYIYYLKIVV